MLSGSAGVRGGVGECRGYREWGVFIKGYFLLYLKLGEKKERVREKKTSF